MKISVLVIGLASLSLFAVQEIAAKVGNYLNFNTEKEIALPSFTKMEVFGNVDVFISEAQDQFVKVVGDVEQIENVSFSVEDNVLYLSHGSKYHSKNRVQVYIQLPKIEVLKASGAVDIIGKGLLTMEDGIIHISGNSSILLELSATSITSMVKDKGRLGLAGNAAAVEITIEDRGVLEATNLFVENATISTSSSSDIYIDVSQKLMLDISNKGDVICKSVPAEKVIKRSGKGELLLN